jgi:hypothetical protein
MGWQTERETIQRETQRQRERGASWDSDVIVPAGQALLIGAGVAIGALVVVAVLTAAMGWRFWIPFAAAGVAGGMAFALAAVLLTLDHRRLLWAAEATLGVDLDQDQAIGEPEPSEVLRVEVLENRGNGRHRLAYLDLPGDRDKLALLARGLLNGRGTGQAQWTGKSGPFTRSEYEAIRAQLIERGLATWADPDHHNLGWELNAAGRAMMRRLAERPTPGRSERVQRST